MDNDTVNAVEATETTVETTEATETVTVNPPETAPGLDPIDLRPGLLVVVDVSRRGGCSYRHENEIVTVEDSGKQTKSYEGTVVLDDPDEYKAASKVQTSIKYRFSKLGAHIPVGIIIPLSRGDDVAALDAECAAEVAAFNASAKFTRLDYTALTFKVTGENMRAMERMLDELSAGLNDLERALNTLEPQEMRDVLARMGGYVEMLPDEAAAVLATALTEAKKTADVLSRGGKKISRLESKLAVMDAGENPQETVDRLNSESATKDMRQRAKLIQKILDDKAETIEAIAETKANIANVPVNLARFACMRKVSVVSEVEATETRVIGFAAVETTVETGETN